MKKTLGLLCLCLLAISASGKPAYRGPITRTTEDGTEKIVYLHGNEHFHYMTDKDGQWIDERTLQPMSDACKTARLDAAIARKSRRVQQQKSDIGDQPNPAPRGLLILVNFQDVAFQTPEATIDSMLNGINYTRNYSYQSQYYDYRGRLKTTTVKIQSSGSARQYFYDQSYGQYNPQFDVVGPVTVSEEMAYYGGNDRSGNDKNAEKMIEEACDLANEQLGVDFSQYDNDDDGFVDFVYVIYAGYGEADGGSENTIWPHQWNLYSYGGIRHKIDGKYLDRYACGSELSYVSDQYDGIGTFCHEFSHVLGLPDLYSTSSSATTHKTMGQWDILDYGPYNNDGNTPPAYSAYERFYMGWLIPRVMKDPESVYLSPLNYGQGESLLLCSGDSHNLTGYNPNPKTFYLAEVRTLSGWDAYLPGKGLLLTKIQYSSSKWTQNTVNNSASSMGVDLIEADGQTPEYDEYNIDNGYWGKAGDAFPSGAKEWTGLADHEITEIALEENGAVTFSYRGAKKTPIEQVSDEGKPAVKVLRDGKLYIIRGGETFDLTGRKAL